MPNLLARSLAEAQLYLLLHPCQECGEAEFTATAAPGVAGGELLIRYEWACPGCGSHREFTFQLVGEAEPADGSFGDSPSELIDPGEWLWFADRLSATVPGDIAELAAAERVQAEEDLHTAAEAVGEALKFIPDDLDFVPYSAFRSPLGRATYAAEPGRFRRVRLEAARDFLLRSADGAAGVIEIAEETGMPDREPLAEFEVARVFDTTALDGTAIMGPDHERIADPAERERLLEYLRAAPVAILVMNRDTDRFQSARGPVVPMSFRTDGTWMWSDELAYYLEQYAFAPEPALRRHIEGNGYQVPEVPADVLLAASRVPVEPGR